MERRSREALPLLLLSTVVVLDHVSLRAFAGNTIEDQLAPRQPVRIVDFSDVDPELTLTQLLPIPAGFIGLIKSRNRAATLALFDSHANQTGSFEIPGRDGQKPFVQKIAADELGNIAVLQSRRIQIFNSARQVAATIDLEFPVQDLALIGGRAFILAENQVVEMPEKRIMSNLDSGGFWRLAPMGGATLAAVDAVSLQLVVIDTSTNTATPSAVTSPEIQKAIQANVLSTTPTSKALLFSSMAMDRAGLLYVTLSPWPDYAAEIIAFDALGHIARSIRLSLPEYPTVPKSTLDPRAPINMHLVPSVFAVGNKGKELFIYSQSHNKFAIYSLDGLGEK